MIEKELKEIKHLLLRLFDKEAFKQKLLDVHSHLERVEDDVQELVAESDKRKQMLKSFDDANLQKRLDSIRLNMERGMDTHDRSLLGLFSEIREEKKKRMEWKDEWKGVWEKELKRIVSEQEQVKKELSRISKLEAEAETLMTQISSTFVTRDLLLSDIANVQIQTDKRLKAIEIAERPKERKVNEFEQELIAFKLHPIGGMKRVEVRRRRRWLEFLATVTKENDVYY